MERPYQTTYRVAVDWLRPNLILCNNIYEIDESVWDNERFSHFDEDENETEIYQWYLTDLNESDVEWLEEHFGLLFTYSDKLDCYVLCVDHLGTAWDYVSCDTDLENAKCGMGGRFDTTRKLVDDENR